MIVGVAAEVDDIRLVNIERAGERIAFLPDLIAGVHLEQATEQRVLDGRDALDRLAGVGIDVNEVANVTAVGHFHFIGQVIRSANALDQPVAVHVELGCSRVQT